MLKTTHCFIGTTNGESALQIYILWFFFQWVEESFTNFQKGINWRSYVVCDVAYSNANNWLWTPFIDRGEANRIYIEIKFTIRDCSLFPGESSKNIIALGKWNFYSTNSKSIIRSQSKLTFKRAFL